VLTVRAARLDDAPRLSMLTAQLGYAADAAALAGRLERCLARPDHLVLVAGDPETGSVDGWIHAADTETLEVGRHGVILGLVVDARARRTGVGRALVAAAERWAAVRGLADLWVRSNVVRVAAHAFYAGLGYERIKTQHVYRRRIGTAAATGLDRSAAVGAGSGSEDQ